MSEISTNSVSLSWSPPTDIGELPIDYYIVEKKSSGSGQYTFAERVPGHLNNTILKGLREDTLYFFRILAENAVGQSKDGAELKDGVFTLKPARKYTLMVVTVY